MGCEVRLVLQSCRVFTSRWTLLCSLPWIQLRMLISVPKSSGTSEGFIHAKTFATPHTSGCLPQIEYLVSVTCFTTEKLRLNRKVSCIANHAPSSFHVDTCLCWPPGCWHLHPHSDGMRRCDLGHWLGEGDVFLGKDRVLLPLPFEEVARRLTVRKSDWGSHQPPSCTLTLYFPGFRIGEGCRSSFQSLMVITTAWAGQCNADCAINSCLGAKTFLFGICMCSKVLIQIWLDCNRVQGKAETSLPLCSSPEYRESYRVPSHKGGRGEERGLAIFSCCGSYVSTNGLVWNTFRNWDPWNQMYTLSFHFLHGCLPCIHSREPYYTHVYNLLPIFQGCVFTD